MSSGDPSADNDTIKMKSIYLIAAVLAILTASAISIIIIDPHQAITWLTTVPSLGGFKRVSEYLVIDSPMSSLIDPQASKSKAHGARTRLKWYVFKIILTRVWETPSL